MRIRTHVRIAALLVALLPGGCLVGGAPGPASPGPRDAVVAGTDVALPPVGYGTLRQEDLTLTLGQAEVLVKVTPLEEWIIRLAAPDTYQRLSELAAAHRSALEREAGEADPRLFLVSFFSGEPQAAFHPDDVELLERGRRYRPEGIRPLTSGWGRQRLAQRETQMAVYGYDPEVELDAGLVVEYRDTRNTEWDGVLQRLQSELARVRVRSGGDPFGPGFTLPAFWISERPIDEDP